MQTIIGRACSELGVPATPARRCVRVQAWLAERLATVYPALPNFDVSAAPLMGVEPGAPSALPDALCGETSAFVSLPLVDVMNESERVTAGEAFGAVFDPAAPEMRGTTPTQRRNVQRRLVAPRPPVRHQPGCARRASRTLRLQQRLRCE